MKLFPFTLAVKSDIFYKSCSKFQQKVCASRRLHEKWLRKRGILSGQTFLPNTLTLAGLTLYQTLAGQTFYQILYRRNHFRGENIWKS